MTNDAVGQRHWRHALVLGGSVAGLLAARVLADHFQEITLLDRDPLLDTAEPREGAPQSRHIHVLWSGGANVIEQLFPGILKELADDGAIRLDPCHELRWYHHGVWKLRVPSNIAMHTQSRSFLEQHIRRRLAAHPRVTFRQAVVASPTVNPEGTRITGVRVLPGAPDGTGGADGADQIVADLVVDATGRGSQLPQWLETLGFARPRETEVGIDLAYSSRIFHRPDDAAPDWKVLAIYPKTPGGKRSGVIFPIEGRRWIVTLAGCLGCHPPGDDAGFLSFARQLEQPDLAEAIARAEPASPIATYRFPSQLRRHYERLDKFPDGLLALGDALCSFNPLYGQGMTVCALQAKMLGEMLSGAAGAASHALAGLPLRFYRAVRPIVDNPWLLATCSDFLYPETTGRRPLGTRALGWYLVQLLELSAHDRRIVTRFHEVLHFLKPPTALFHPSIVLQALKWGLGWRRG